MIPIGIVTRDRVPYLDVTLRSLSATALPPDISITVFDDGSVDAASKTYYQTNKTVQVETHWPKTSVWRSIGLNVISDNYLLPVGIAGKVRVEQIGSTSKGVVNSSCNAIKRLFTNHPNAPGVFLLQDDVIFKREWYERFQDTLARSKEFTDKQVGLMAGIKLNQKMMFSSPPLATQSGITAQCIYLSRDAYRSLAPAYFFKTHSITQKFDDTLRRHVDRAGYWAGCIYPFVCQHFGIKSLVRPKRRWEQGTKGRVGYYVHPPYALADAVRQFGG